MKIYLGTDHAGFALKEKLKAFLQGKQYDVVDCGAFSFDKDDDYPDFIGKAAQGVSEEPGSRGIVLGGSGQGETMVANKLKGVRCALFYTPAIAIGETDITGSTSTDPFEIVRLSRVHNDANMLSLSARFLKEEDAIQAVQVFLETEFSNEERHKKRIEKITTIEER